MTNICSFSAIAGGGRALPVKRYLDIINRGGDADRPAQDVEQP